VVVSLGVSLGVKSVGVLGIGGMIYRWRGQRSFQEVIANTVAKMDRGKKAER
jgi:hypothetical protein